MLSKLMYTSLMLVMALFTAPADAQLQGQLRDADVQSITTGGAAQTLLPAISQRKYFLFQNISDIDMWINFNNDATPDTPSVKVTPGGAYEFRGPGFVPTLRISVYGVTTGKKFVCKEAQ